MRDIDEISGDVLHLALRIHRDLGPGLLESVCELVLAGKLMEMGYSVARQKSVEQLNAAHGKQLLTYLRLLKQPVGLLLNFGGGTLKEGVRRIVNDHHSSASSRLRVNQKSGD